MTAAAQSTGRAAAPYKPRAGSIADRAVDHLQSLPDGTEVMTTALAHAIMCEPLTLPPCLDAPIKHGLIFRRQKDDHPRSPWWYCAIDKSAMPKVARVLVDVPVKTPQEGDNRDASAGQSHGAGGSESPNGRGTDGAPALGASPTRSPVGGPMGAEQPAAAGLAVASDRLTPAEYVKLIGSDDTKPVEKPEARIGLRGKTAALWLTGELALEADDGTVIVFEPALVQRMAKFLLPSFEAEA